MFTVAADFLLPVGHSQKGALTAVRLPGMLVALTERKPTGGSQGTVMDHFGFKVRNLATFLAKWRAADLPVISEFTGAEGLPNAYVMVPDDVRVELQEDQALPVEVAAYHIHFLTPESEGLHDWYLETFSLERRPRGLIETTTNVPGMNLSFGNARAPTLATMGPVDRPHRVRARRPGSLLRDAHGARCRV